MTLPSVLMRDNVIRLVRVECKPLVCARHVLRVLLPHRMRRDIPRPRVGSPTVGVTLRDATRRSPRWELHEDGVLGRPHTAVALLA